MSEDLSHLSDRELAEAVYRHVVALRSEVAEVKTIATEARAGAQLAANRLDELEREGGTLHRIGNWMLAVYQDVQQLRQHFTQQIDHDGTERRKLTERTETLERSFDELEQAFGERERATGGA